MRYRVLKEQRSWALTLGTLFFALLAYWLVAGSLVPESNESSEVGLVLRSILSADAAWFLLMGWILTTSFYLGSAHWSDFFAKHLKWTRASRTVAWKRFRTALWFSLATSLVWVGTMRSIGLLNIQNPGFDPMFLLRELHLITDPLSSFVLLFVVLDVIRCDLYNHALKSHYAMIVAFLVSIGVETWVWAEYLGLGFDSLKLLPLILAVLWGALLTYEALLKSRLGAFWVRFGWAVGVFCVFDIGLALLDSPWSSGWSFYLSEVPQPALLVACGAGAFAAANAATLHRFSKSLTRTD